MNITICDESNFQILMLLIFIVVLIYADDILIVAGWCFISDLSYRIYCMAKIVAAVESLAEFDPGLVCRLGSL